ncbi:hypothetical protein ACT3TC_16750 [Halomonas sp. AOP27-A1-41]|uniref:hypothetical protein n=1 Tax=Halomonas sp. AOP27-A1-41 TaxID=3457707 RepID=UPI004033A1C2
MLSIIVNIQKVLWALNGLGQVTLQPGFMALFLLLMATTSQKVGYSKYRSSLDPVSWGGCLGVYRFTRFWESLFILSCFYIAGREGGGMNSSAFNARRLLREKRSINAPVVAKWDIWQITSTLRSRKVPIENPQSSLFCLQKKPISSHNVLCRLC